MTEYHRQFAGESVMDAYNSGVKFDLGLRADKFIAESENKILVALTCAVNPSK